MRHGIRRPGMPCKLLRNVLVCDGIFLSSHMQILGRTMLYSTISISCASRRGTLQYPDSYGNSVWGRDNWAFGQADRLVFDNQLVLWVRIFNSPYIQTLPKGLV